MSTSFYDLITSPEARRAHQLAYSLQMVGDIARTYAAALDRIDYACARCMVDAFYVHLRLLADFLVKRTKDKDFGPADFGVDWAIPSSDAARRLTQHWNVASSYVVHFGRPRVPDNLEDLEAFRVSGEQFRAMAADAFTVFHEFLEALRATTLPWQDGARVPDRQMEPEAWQARNLADRTAIILEAFQEASLDIVPNLETPDAHES